MRGGPMLCLTLGAVSCALGLSAGPVGAEPPGPANKPFLRIEAGMHTATIRCLDVDRAGERMVTVSMDKTARIWDLKTGRLLRILRPRIGEDYEGSLYAAAFSPDGKTVAVGGWTGRDRENSHSVYLFDAQSGEMQGRIAGLPNVITHLSYSKNGGLLALSLGETNGVRVYRTSDLTLRWQDTDYSDGSYWVEFDRKGRLVATSYDGDVRLYGPDFRLLARRSVKGGKQPYSARFSPNGKLVVVGFNDTTAVTVLAGDTLAFRYAPDVSGLVGGNLSTACWSQDGSRLYAGGRTHGSGKPALFAWSQAGRGPRAEVASSPDNTIMDIRVVDAARLVFGGAGPAWAIVDAGGRTPIEQGPPTLDYRMLTQDENKMRFHVSLTGDRLQFGFDVYRAGTRDRQLASFDLGSRTLELNPKKSPDGLVPPRTTGLPIERWKNEDHPTLAGRPIDLDRHEKSCGLAITRDKQRFLLGTAWWLRFFERTGKQLWKGGIPGAAWAVNLTEDGRWAVAAFDDGTIRWYTTKDGSERLALFPHPDGKRWLAWTPEGFFTGSPGAEALAGYHLNQGPDKAGEFVAMEQLSDLFYRPDLVTHALDEDAPQRMRIALERIGDVRRVLASGLPPMVEIVADKVQQDGDQVTLPVRLKNRGGGLGRLVVRVNGAEQAARGEVPGIPGQGPISMGLRLPTGKSVVTVSAYNGKGEIESRPAEWTFEVAAPKRASRTLHVLAAGVTRYQDRALKLRYASDDAREVAAQWKKSAQGLFDEVDVPEPLVDDNVTFDKLGKAFDAMAQRMKPDDVFVFFMAGHGTARDGRYLFLPADLEYVNDDDFRRSAIDEGKLQRLLARIPAQKSLILFDTCSAGTFGKTSSRDGLEEKAALDRLMKTTGRAFIAATADEQMALEGYNGHGVFTAALLRGLSSAEKDKKVVDTDGNGLVDVEELATFLAREVPRMSQEKFNTKQTPQRRLDLRGEAFPVAKSR